MIFTPEVIQEFTAKRVQKMLDVLMKLMSSIGDEGEGKEVKTLLKDGYGSLYQAYLKITGGKNIYIRDKGEESPRRSGESDEKAKAE